MTIRMNLAKNEGSLGPFERQMAAQTVERLHNTVPGDAIIATCGVLWVTQSGDPEDYMLKQGEAFVAKRQGTVVVEAFTPAAYRVTDRSQMYEWMRLGLEGTLRPTAAGQADDCDFRNHKH
jgi:hypothetical protein